MTLRVIFWEIFWCRFKICCLSLHSQKQQWCGSSVGWNTCSSRMGVAFEFVRPAKRSSPRSFLYIWRKFWWHGEKPNAIKKPVSKGYWLCCYLLLLYLRGQFFRFFVLDICLGNSALFDSSQDYYSMGNFLRAFAGTFVATVRTILVVWTLLVAVCLSWTFFSWAVVIVWALVCLHIRLMLSRCI